MKTISMPRKFRLCRRFLDSGNVYIADNYDSLEQAEIGLGLHEEYNTNPDNVEFYIEEIITFVHRSR